MRPTRTAVAGVAVGAVIVLDHYATNPIVALGVKIDVGDTATYKVEHTFDDVFSPTFNPATAIWYPHATLNNLSANADGNYAYPPAACRLNVSAHTGPGNVTLTVNQAGIV